LGVLDVAENVPCAEGDHAYIDVDIAGVFNGKDCCAGSLFIGEVRVASRGAERADEIHSRSDEARSQNRVGGLIDAVVDERCKRESALSGGHTAVLTSLGAVE
jgi:hypothetical protein